MHEALVGPGDAERRKVLLDSPTIVHQCVRIVRTIRVVVDKFLQPQVPEQTDSPSIAKVRRQHSSAGLGFQDPDPGERVSGEQRRTPEEADRDQVVQRPARIHHDDQFPAGPQDAMDLALSLLDVRHVVQDAMAENHVKRVVGERQLQHAALPEIFVGSSRSVSRVRTRSIGLGGQVDAGPAGTLPDQEFGIRSLAQADLEQLLARDVQRLDAGRQVTLVW